MIIPSDKKFGGGITPSGTINITENGTVDVTNYATADVNVHEKTGLAKWLSNETTELIDDTVTEIRRSGTGAFRYNTSITAIIFPNAELPTGYSPYQSFSNMSALKIAILPKIAKVHYTFTGDSNLERVELNSVTDLGQYSFSSCSKFKTLLVETRPFLPATNTFDSTPFRTGDKSDPSTCGTVFCRYADVNWFPTAYNWKNLQSTLYKAIEENLVTLLSLGVDITDYYAIVSELPTTDIDDTIVYFIETATSGTYEQWFHGSGSWEQLANITLEGAE